VLEDPLLTALTFLLDLFAGTNDAWTGFNVYQLQHGGSTTLAPTEKRRLVVQLQLY
jgi:hypothetical protein